MRLTDEIHVEIQAFVSGRIAARDLEGWLDCASAEVHAPETPDLRALTDRAYSLFAEVSYGDRSVEDARREMGKLLAETARTDRIESKP